MPVTICWMITPVSTSEKWIMPISAPAARGTTIGKLRNSSTTMNATRVKVIT